MKACKKDENETKQTQEYLLQNWPWAIKLHVWEVPNTQIVKLRRGLKVNLVKSISTV